MIIQMPLKKDYEADVKIFKEWYSKQYHLPQNIDEEYFYNFVSGTNSLEKAKRKIDAYFTLRKRVSEVLSDVGPNTYAFQEHCRQTGMAILPGTTPEGYRVIFSSTWNKDSDYYDSGAQLFKNLLLIEIGLHLWPTDTSYILVQDLKWMPNSAVKTVHLKHILVLSKILRKGLPIKMKKFYSYNAPTVLYAVISMVRTFLPKKLNDRIVFAKDNSLLKEVVPVEIIPSEAGGEGKSLRELDEYWSQELKAREKWFEEKAKLQSDESKRVKDSFKMEDVDLGIESSFNTLNID